MTAVPTARAASEAAGDARRWARTTLHRVLDETRHSLAELAAACDVSADTAEGWASGRKHLPLYVFVNARVPRSVRGRMVAAMATLLEEAAVRVGLDAATARLLSRAGECVAMIGTAWSDRVLDAAERRALRTLVAELVAAGATWLREEGVPDGR